MKFPNIIKKTWFIVYTSSFHIELILVFGNLKMLDPPMALTGWTRIKIASVTSVYFYYRLLLKTWIRL